MATTKKDAKSTKKKASTKAGKPVKKTPVDSKVEEVTVKPEVKEKKKPEDKKVKVVEKKKEKKESKKGLFARIKTFFHEVKKEMSYVKWPSRKDMIKYSVATICFVLFFSFFFYIIDLIVAAVKTWV